MRRFVCLLVVMITFVVAFPVEGQDGSSVVTHVVQPGENLYRIALLYDTSVEAIMQANGLANPDVVVLGQELIIPVPEESTPVPVSSYSSSSIFTTIREASTDSTIPV